MLQPYLPTPTDRARNSWSTLPVTSSAMWMPKPEKLSRWRCLSPACRSESIGKLPCGAETGQGDPFLLRPLYPCRKTGNGRLYAFMGQGLCGAETGGLAYPQPYIRLYHSQGTSRIQQQGNHGAFGGLLCGKGEGHIAGLP